MPPRVAPRDGRACNRLDHARARALVRGQPNRGMARQARVWHPRPSAPERRERHGRAPRCDRPGAGLDVLEREGHGRDGWPSDRIPFPRSRSGRVQHFSFLNDAGWSPGDSAPWTRTGGRARPSGPLRRTMRSTSRILLRERARRPERRRPRFPRHGEARPPTDRSAAAPRRPPSIAAARRIWARVCDSCRGGVRKLSPRLVKVWLIARPVQPEASRPCEWIAAVTRKRCRTC